VILDDAKSQIYCTQLVEEESTVTVLQVLRKVIEQEGFSVLSAATSHFEHSCAFLLPTAISKTRLRPLATAESPASSHFIHLADWATAGELAHYSRRHRLDRDLPA